MADEKYPKKTWGEYEYDDDISLDENMAAADKANALIKTEDAQRWEDWLAKLDEREMTPGPQGEPGKDGARGPEGPAGKAGAAGIGVKSITLTVDADGKVTGGTMTKTDNSTAAITVTTA